MGRCNNRRTQEQAQAFRNRPARARFSQPPPFVQQQQESARRRRNTNSNATSQPAPAVPGQQQQQSASSSQPQTRGNRHHHATNHAKSNVVDKMAHRLHHRQTSGGGPNPSPQTRQRRQDVVHQKPFPGKVEDLDLMELSDAAVERIYHVLATLQVIQVPPSVPEDTYSSNDEEEQEGSFVDGSSGRESDSVDGEDTRYDDMTDSMPRRRYIPTARSDGYEGDDMETAGGVTNSAVVVRPGGHAADEWDVEWEGSVDANASQHRPEMVEDDIEDQQELVRNDPVFRYLTQHLSFTTASASRACLALQHWQGAAAASAALPSKTESSWKMRLGLAVDWLSLHLDPSELAAAFQRNTKSTTPWSNDNGGSNSSVYYTAIPHPSISLATKLTDDTDLLKQLKLDQLSLGFVQLGFPYSDVISVLEVHPNLDQVAQEPLLDDATLGSLLLKLEQLALQDSAAEPDEVSTAELAVEEDCLKDERDEEKLVLAAVYDEDFEVVPTESPQITRYKIRLSNLPMKLVGGSTEATGSAHADLHVFLLPKYPVESPLFLYSCSFCDVLLLRRINIEIVRHVRDLRGSPCIYETVTFITERLEWIVTDFQKERRTQEFEETQRMMRQEVDQGLEHSNELDSKSTKLGRRQIAKVKSAERAYNRNEILQQQDLERQRLQEKRIEKVKVQHKYLRQSMADQEIERREMERMEEGIRKASRSAMLAALNSGASIEEARECATKAEIDFKKAHWQYFDVAREVEEYPSVDTSLSNVFDADDAPADQARARDENGMASINPSSTTAAFMERLRALYDAAAEAKSKGVVYRKARNSVDKPSRVPCPVALHVGDLADVIDEVVTVQSKQPWLISPEARVPEFQVEEATRSTASDASHTSPDELSKKLKFQLDEMQAKPQFKSIQKMRQKLPAYQLSDELVRVISTSQVTVVSGATGCGKSLCTPQLVLDDMIRRGMGSHANIIVTQPRRISAVGVAERMAVERLESVGETCGYSIKLEKRVSQRTRILLCTTGILLRRLQCDPDLATVSHVFLDEVHERDLNTDFLLIIVKDLLKRRPSLKLVLMSATLNAESFVEYFPGCKSVSIPGRAHPVTEYRFEDALKHTGYEVPENSDYAKKEGPSNRPATRLPKKELLKLYPDYSASVLKSLAIVDESVINYELLALLLLYIVENYEQQGAILVFLPGIMEISKALDEIRKIEKFQSSAFRILPLHSSLSTADQVAVFEVPPNGVRKIVLSTNIAETSITIEDIEFVVDCGRVKENRRDEIKETPALVECWVSRASSKQRRGRAGRVRPGIAYHMFSSYTYDNILEEHQLPEMLRVGLEDLVLQILTLDLGEPYKFLMSALTPPSSLAMKNSLKLLENLGAVDCKWDEERDNDLNPTSSGMDELHVSTELTALGFHLAALPVDPRVGKLMIYGALFGCAGPAFTIAAAMTATKPVFVSPFENRDAANEAKRAVNVEGSDPLTILKAFNEWKRLRQTKGNRAANAFTRDSFLSRPTLFQMEDLRRHYAGLLVDIGFLPKGFKLDSAAVNNEDSTRANANNDKLFLLRAILCAGLYPNIIVAPRSLADVCAAKEAGECAFQSKSKGDVYLHPCTVSFASKGLGSRYCCFYEIIRTSKMYVRDLTPVSILAVVLFGGSIETYPKEGVVTVDDWLRFRVHQQAGKEDYVAAPRVALIKHLRLQLETMLLRKIVNPDEGESSSKESMQLIDAIVALLGECDLSDACYNTGVSLRRNPHATDGRPSRDRGRQGRGSKK